MAAHRLTIAKASFTAALLRPEAVSLTRDSIAQFHTLLDSALASCTSSNIQNCKAWLLDSIVPFPARLAALGKYLVSLSKLLALEGENNNNNIKSEENGKATTGLSRATSISRRRLHILYLLNDLLHHTKHHVQGNKEFSMLTSSLPQYLAELTTTAATDAKPKVRGRLESLLQIWLSEAYFASDFVTKLKTTLDDNQNSLVANDGQNGNGRSSLQDGGSVVKDVPYIMPSTHGDPSTPFYDLPAGNLLPHIVPNSAVPIRPENIRPLQFLAGPADESLVQALKDFMEDVDRIDDGARYARKGPTEDGLIVEIDELGQVFWRDEKTGDIVKGDTYYGWSREFCEKMKRRRKGDTQRGMSRSRSRTYDSSSSRSRSHSPDRRGTTKRRHSSTRSDSRSRSYSRSRSPPARRRSYSSSSDHDRPSFSKSISSTRPQTFVQPIASGQQQQQLPQSLPPPPPHPYQYQGPSPPLPLPPAPPFGVNFPPNTSGSPPPPFPHAIPPPPPHLSALGNLPPRPAGYNGPWPPPPPPPPMMGYGPGVNNAGTPPPPPPPGLGMGIGGQGRQHPPPPPSGRGGWQNQYRGR